MLLSSKQLRRSLNQRNSQKKASRRKRLGQSQTSLLSKFLPKDQIEVRKRKILLKKTAMKKAIKKAMKHLQKNKLQNLAMLKKRVVPMVMCQLRTTILIRTQSHPPKLPQQSPRRRTPLNLIQILQLPKRASHQQKLKVLTQNRTQIPLLLKSPYQPQRHKVLSPIQTLTLLPDKLRRRLLSKLVTQTKVLTVPLRERLPLRRKVAIQTTTTLATERGL